MQGCNNNRGHWHTMSESSQKTSQDVLPEATPMGMRACSPASSVSFL